jgi:D-inositol-3-phosphate glycosyltransferase
LGSHDVGKACVVRLDMVAADQRVHVRELSSALVAAGHDVTVWTRRDRPDQPDAHRTGSGVTVRHIDVGPPRGLAEDELVPHLPALADVLRATWAADPPDVVHAHYWISGLAALSAAEYIDVPVAQTFHALGCVERRHLGRDDTSPNGRARAERHLARTAQHIFATCSAEFDELLGMGAARNRISVVPYGVDTTGFTVDGPAHPRGARPRLVALGGLARRKGVDETVAALVGLPDAELVVAGGTAAADPDIARLRALAAARGVDDRVRFIGPVPHGEVPALLRSADVVVCVPWYEPFGVVALEAMACGRPVVASAVGGLVDTVVDGVTGLLVPPRRPRDAAAALRKILASPARQQAMGVAGRDRAEMRYTWPRVARATAAIYQALRGHAADQPLTGTVGRCPSVRDGDV